MQPPPPPPLPRQAQLPALRPGDIGTIFELLRKSLSNVNADQKASEAALKEHESQEGFCSCLAEIIGTKAADYSAKFSAAVLMKNCITKYWRPRLNSASVTIDEKQHLRKKLLELLPQDDSQIALQLAVTFAKVARMDFPKAWPSLVTDVMATATASPLAARRAYVVLHHILKELSTKRLVADQKTFAQVTAQLYEGVWGQWISDTRHLLERLPAALAAHPQPEQDALTFERWLILLKALRRLVVYGFEHDHRSLRQVPVVAQVLPAVHSAMAAMLPMRAAAARPPSKLHAMLDRGLLKLAKVATNILEAHPWSSFHCGALQSLTTFFADHVVSAAESAPAAQQSSRRYLIRSMLFLQAALRPSTFRKATSAVNQLAAFKLSGSKEQEASLQSMQSQLVHSQSAFWDPDRLSAVVRALILKYFPLTAADLSSWHADGEEFYHDSDISSFHDNLRTCAEALYLMLFERNREAVAPLVLSIAQTACRAAPPGCTAQIVAQNGPSTGGIPNDVLISEAALAAMGVGAFELHDYVDFGPWFEGTLLPTMGDSASEAAPLRLRAALVVAKWTPRMAEGHRSAAYGALLLLLDSGDAAIQLAAISALQALLDDWGFAEASFAGVAGRLLHLLAAFVRSATELDSQLQAFHLFGIVIDRLQADVAPFASDILQLLPEVWAAADSRPLMRSQVLMALQRLLLAAGPAGSPTNPEAFLLPALRYSCDPDGPEALNLLEDGLATWLTALRCAPTLDQRLTDLFPLLASVLRHSTEHVQAAASIMCSCLLMEGAAFLSRHGSSLGATLATTFSAVGERGVLALLPVAQLILTAWPEEGATLLQELHIRLLATVLQGGESSLIITSCLAVLARLLLHNRDAFLRLFSAAAALPMPIFQQHSSGGPDPAQSLLAALVDVWLDKTDAIGAPPDRKLSAAALEAALTVLPPPVLLPRLDVIVAHVTSVCYEMEGEGEDDRYRYSVLAARRGGDASCGAVVPSEEAEGESQRWMQLYDADPVNHMRLSDAFREQMVAAAALHGSQFTAALQELDPALQSQLHPIFNT